MGYSQSLIVKDEVDFHFLPTVARAGVVRVLHKLKGPPDAGPRRSLPRRFNPLANTARVVLCRLLNTSVVEFRTG